MGKARKIWEWHLFFRNRYQVVARFVENCSETQCTKMHKAWCEAFVGEMLGKARAFAERKGWQERLRPSQALEPYFSALIFQHLATWFQIFFRDFSGKTWENYGCFILRDFQNILRV